MKNAKNECGVTYKSETRNEGIDLLKRCCMGEREEMGGDEFTP
jgi:hypothetical protein